ncbi:uncharacterized protein LOC110677742 [Aedes aegypti]|uniref:Uncharacterized protein n=1 Tax=Aedes aegypti TaxID=7159 RepID=A0A6I8U8G1_AEDAE|nr:uncharacterized protein LOC110677742 [Aedes aegypti]
MNHFVVFIPLVVTFVTRILADSPSPMPTDLHKLFNETTLPCTPHEVVNHACYFCKCNFHGNRQHCVYTCDPETGRPVMPGSKMCNANDEFAQGCKRCRCSKGELFFDCFITNVCNDGSVGDEEF